MSREIWRPVVGRNLDGDEKKRRREKKVPELAIAVVVSSYWKPEPRFPLLEAPPPPLGEGGELFLVAESKDAGWK